MCLLESVSILIARFGITREEETTMIGNPTILFFAISFSFVNFNNGEVHESSARF